MSKEKERRTGHILYVEQGKTAKEVAELIGVAEKTVGEWVNKYGWREERLARQASPQKRAGNIKMIITNLSEDRLELDRKTRQAEADGRQEELLRLREEMSRIDDAVSKWNKTLENIEKENQVTLATYLGVMDRIFQSMREFDTKLFMSTVEFQEYHINKVALTLG